MKIIEEAIKDLDSLKPADLLLVYDLILSLKGKLAVKRTMSSAYIKVRQALKGCNCSLSDDIIHLREDRI